MKSYDLSNPEQKCDDIILSDHLQYLDILNTIRKDTEKIVIVQVCGKDDSDVVVNTAKEMMTLEKTEFVNEWFGTVQEGEAAAQYTFLKKRDFFDFLSSFEAFFIVTSLCPYEVKRTDFGLDDIAFLDRSGEVLFYTTTHEGYAYLNKKYSLNRGENG